MWRPTSFTFLEAFSFLVSLRTGSAFERFTALETLYVCLDRIQTTKRVVKKEPFITHLPRSKSRLNLFIDVTEQQQQQH